MRPGKAVNYNKEKILSEMGPQAPSPFLQPIGHGKEPGLPDRASPWGLHPIASRTVFF